MTCDLAADSGGSASGSAWPADPPLCAAVQAAGWPFKARYFSKYRGKGLEQGEQGEGSPAWSSRAREQGRAARGEGAGEQRRPGGLETLNSLSKRE